MNAIYQTADSRLAAFILVKGFPLQGTETKFRGSDDRVMLTFEIDADTLAGLKRDFFEGGLVPALTYANACKEIMHCIREARELSREAVQN